MTTESRKRSLFQRIFAPLGLLGVMLLLAAQTYDSGSHSAATMRGVWVQGADTVRVKAWNSWPQPAQIATTNPAASVAGPENFQFKLVIKFIRAADEHSRKVVTVTKIGTMDNDRGAAGVTSAGIMAFPLGAAAGKGKTDATASATMNTKTISSCTVANPTVCLTGSNHTLTTGDMINISAASGFTPAVGSAGFPALQYVTVTDPTHFSIPVNLTGCSSCTATLNSSRTLVVGTGGFFNADDVGKNLESTVGGSLCSASDVLSDRCQGPKFPIVASGVTWQGTIIGFTDATHVTVKPSFAVNPGGSATIRVEPILRADEDGVELGDGWIVGVDINFWQGTPKRGQSFFEAEINRGSYVMHQGIPLIKCYLGTSEHCGWDGEAVLPEHKASWPGALLTYRPGDVSFFPAIVRGADWTYTVPTNSRQRLKSCIGTLTTSATVNNRQIVMGIDDGSNPILAPVTSTLQTASQVVRYTWSGSPVEKSVNPAVGTTIRQYVALPATDLELNEGSRIIITTLNLDTNGSTGDLWSATGCYFEEVIEE